jgi:PKD repeat protein
VDPTVAQCGNGLPNPGETCANCPEDLPHCELCGNGQPDPGEDCRRCPEDIPACATCGNGHPDPGETCATCPRDCVPAHFCGDHVQDPGETCDTCPGDVTGGCGPSPLCHLDGVCQSGVEDCGNCPQDCPCANGLVCPGRTCVQPGSLPGCGNGVADPGEACSSCALDLAAKPLVTPSKLYVSVGEAVSFSASPALLPTPSPLWSFGDATPSQPGASATHAYANAGNYLVTVTGREAHCGTTVTSAPHVVYVRAEVCRDANGIERPCCGNGQCDPSDHRYCPSDCQPALCDTLVCAAGCAERPALISDSFQVAPLQPVRFSVFSDHTDDLTPSWDFGDGQHCAQCGRSVTHTYAQPGNYKVILTAHESVCGTVQLSYPYTVVVGATGPQQRDDALLTEFNLPSCVRPGSSGSFSLTFLNNGATRWISSGSGGYRLAVSAPDLTALTSVPLLPGDIVEPDESKLFRIPYNAPSQPGSARFFAMMRNPRGDAFGAPVGLTMLVRDDCEEPPAPGEFTCEVRLHQPTNNGQQGDPIPDVNANFAAWVFEPDQAPRQVALDVKRTDQAGRATLKLSPGEPVQQIQCNVPDVEPVNGPNFVTRADPVAVPSGTVVELDLQARVMNAGATLFEGLKPGVTKGYLTRSGPYDKPVVIAMPFDPGEQSGNGLTVSKLYGLFGALRQKLAERGYDVWQLKTRTGQNFHEQAAEFAQALDYAGRLLDEPGDSIAVGYSGGGVATRLATARYEADADWRDALGVRDQLPTDLIVFGDAPLLGANANGCLQHALWETIHPFKSVASKFNLNSCGAQGLLRSSYPTGDLNHRRLFETGESIVFPLGRGGLRGVCDQQAPGGQNCVCDAGPALTTVGLDHNGWARRPRLIAMSESVDNGTGQTCYHDANKDRGADGQRGCSWDLPGPYPRQFDVGEPLVKIRVAAGSDYYCAKEPGDVQAGSKMSAMFDERECFLDLGFGACGGLLSLDNFTFIPRWSALPAGAPFYDTKSIDHHGFHAKTYASDVNWAVEHMDDVVAERAQAANLERALDDDRRFDIGGGRSADPQVSVTLPDVVGSGTVLLSGSDTTPGAHPGYVLPAGGRYLTLTTTQGFHASWRNPITVCVSLAGMTFMDATRAELFAFDSNGWTKITTQRPQAPAQVCGVSSTLGMFALLESRNHAPLADAGPDRSGVTPPVRLSAAASYDPDGEALSYEWRRSADPAEAPFATSAVTTLALPAGTHVFHLRVRDPRGASTEDSVTIDVAAPQVSAGDAAVVETDTGQPRLVFRAALSWASTTPVTVSWSTSDGNALAGSDYTAAAHTLTIPAGSLGTNFGVDVVGDRLYEGNESLQVILSAPVAAILGDTVGVGTILDDDPMPAASVAHVALPEGHGGTRAALFSVTLDTPSGRPARLSYKTGPGTAGSEDFVAVSGEVVIPVGVTSASIPVAVRGDRLFEPDETFGLELSAAADVGVADGQALATVQNDDLDGPVVSDERVTEPGADHVARFRVWGPSSSTLTVRYATVNGTALAGSDFDAVGGVLTLAPGVPQTVDVPLRGDAVREPPETFALVLYPATTGRELTRGTATLYDSPRDADYDVNGWSDLLWRDGASGRLTAWLMEGLQRRASSATDPDNPGSTFWFPVGTADFDADGHGDLLWQHATSHKLVVWSMRGLVRNSGVFTVPDGADDPAWRVVATGDFDGDTQPDILWRHQVSGRTVVWLMNGVERRLGAFTVPDGVAGMNWSLEASGDLDGDGKLDLLWRNADSGALVAWFMDGLVRRVGEYVLPAESDLDWQVGALVDLTADGRADIVWQHRPTGAVRVWTMDGPLRLSVTALVPDSPVDPAWRLVGPH